MRVIPILVIPEKFLRVLIDYKKLLLNGMRCMESLCWKCKKSCGGENGCSWFNGFIPVQEWKARKTKNGYLVHYCPLFEQDTSVQKPADCVNNIEWEYIRTEDLANRLNMSLRTLFRKNIEKLQEIARKNNFELMVSVNPPKRNFYIKEIKL